MFAGNASIKRMLCRLELLLKELTMALSLQLDRHRVSATKRRSHSSGHWCRVLLRALPGLWIGGCTMPPVQQFEGYARGFEEVRSTTYVLIDDFELAKKAVRASLTCGVSATTTRVASTWPMGASTTTQCPNNAARRRYSGFS
jgi:hypothetical protein